MPWSCAACAVELDDDVASCPACGATKQSWTLQAERTRALRIGGARAKLEALVGEDLEPRPRDDAGATPFPTREAEACPVLPKSTLLALLAEGRLPPPAHRLVARVHPRKLDRAVTLTVERARADAIALEVDGGALPLVDDERFDVQFLCVHGPEDLGDLALPGLVLVDVSDGDGYAPEVEVAAVRKRIELPTRDVSPARLEILEVEDICFATRREVLLPGGWSASDALTGLSAVAGALEHARKHPARRLLLAGHTDTVGSVQSNQVLSEDRARSVHLYVSGQREAWAEHAARHAEHEDAQSVLKWVAWLRGWDCDPGPIDGAWGKGCAAALDRFRARWEAERGGQLPRKAGCQATDWAAFFDLYDDELAFKLRTDAARVAALRAALRFTEPPMIGCSERFPTRRPGAPATNAANRRVDLVFLPDEAVPALPGDPPGAAIYGEGGLARAYLTVDDALREPEPPYGDAPFEDVRCDYEAIHAAPAPDPEEVRIDRDVVHDVPALTASEAVAPAVACAVMVKAWRDRVAVVPAEVAGRTQHWAPYAAALDAPDEEGALDGLGLARRPARAYSAQELVELLEEHGPAWVAGLGGGPAGVRVLTGLVDQGGQVLVQLNDPRPGGGKVSLRYTTFAYELGRHAEAQAAPHQAPLRAAHA